MTLVEWLTPQTSLGSRLILLMILAVVGQPGEVAPALGVGSPEVSVVVGAATTSAAATSTGRRLPTELLVTALALRCPTARVQAATDPAVAPTAFLVQLGSEPGGELRVVVYEPNGQLLADTRMASRGRTTKELVNTIALFVAAVLSPFLPELPLTFRPEPARTAVAPITAAPAAPALTAARSIRMTAGAWATTWLPKTIHTAGVSVAATWTGGYGCVRADANLLAPLSASQGRLTLDVYPWSAQLLAGVHLTYERIFAETLVGGGVRGLEARARGDRVEFRQRHSLDAALAAHQIAGVKLGNWSIEAVAAVNRFAAHPSYMVGDQTLLNTGHTQLGLGLLLGYAPDGWGF